MFKKSGRGALKPFCVNEECVNFVPEDKRGYQKKKKDAVSSEEKKPAAKKTSARSAAAKKPTARKTAKTKE